MGKTEKEEPTKTNMLAVQVKSTPRFPFQVNNISIGGALVEYPPIGSAGSGNLFAIPAGHLGLEPK